MGLNGDRHHPILKLPLDQSPLDLPTLRGSVILLEELHHRTSGIACWSRSAALNPSLRASGRGASVRLATRRTMA